MYQPGRFKGDFTQVQLIGRNSPNPNSNLYDDDWNNFAPVVGLSWSIPCFGKDKTVLRAGLAFPMSMRRCVLWTLLRAMSRAENGSALHVQRLLGFVADRSSSEAGREPLEIVPLTDRTQVVRAFDNNLRTPYVQNWNLSIQRQLPANFILDVRYVGSKGTKLLRSVNLNEVNIFETGLLDAFRTTQAGGNAKLFDEMFLGFNLGNGVVNGTTVTGSSAVRTYSGTRSDLANNSIGSFATFLNQVTVGARGGLLRINDLPENWIVVNPQFGGSILTGNFSNSTYHSLQLNAERRLTRGLMMQSKLHVEPHAWRRRGRWAGYFEQLSERPESAHR